MIALAIIVLLVVSLYWYGTKNYQYWSKRGVKYDKPIPFVGNNLNVYLLRKSVAQIANDLYWKYSNEKVVGFFKAMTPELMIRDPEIIKKVLMSDSNHFINRGLNPNKDHIETLFRNLFFADGDTWKLLRKQLTPAFTSGKLKGMFPLIVERAERLKACTLEAAAAGKVIDVRDLMARYTTDFIGACGFGIDADSLNKEDSPFRNLGLQIFGNRWRTTIRTILKFVFPNLLKELKVLAEVEKTLSKYIEEILKKRNYVNSGRGDFLDLLLECKKKGVIVGESIDKVKKDGTPEIATLELDHDLIIAQVFVFFVAGFETSSSATSFMLHQLAFHPEVQKKVQQEIDTVLAKHGKLCYDSVKEMVYLEMAFKEGMRMFPSVGVLVRETTKKYTFEKLGLTIDAGVKILIPVHALQNDPKYFDNPEEFRPERFSSTEFNPDNKYVYLPFGEGPRNCIGARLGLMQSLAGLAAILSSFTVEPAPSTLRHPISSPKTGLTQTIVGGLPLMFRPRILTLE